MSKIGFFSFWLFFSSPAGFPKHLGFTDADILELHEPKNNPALPPLLAEIELDLLPGCALACGADNLKWHAVFVIDDEPPCPKPKMDEIEF